MPDATATITPEQEAIDWLLGQTLSLMEGVNGLFDAVQAGDGVGHAMINLRTAYNTTMDGFTSVAARLSAS